MRVPVGARVSPAARFPFDRPRQHEMGNAKQRERHTRPACDVLGAVYVRRLAGEASSFSSSSVSKKTNEQSC